jgi:O-antigen/teichoic acid export membrane protein
MQSIKVIKNTLAVSSAQLIPRFLGFLLTVIITRYLGVEKFGIYSFVYVFVSLFGTISEFGIISLLTREIARNTTTAAQYANRIIPLKLFLTAITFIAILVTIRLLNYDKDVRNLIIIVSIALFSNSISTVFDAIFYGFEKMSYQALIAITTKIVSFILCIIFINLHYGLYSFILITPLISVLGMILSYRVIKNIFFVIRPTIDLLFCKEQFILAIPFFLISFFGAIYLKIDTIMLSMLKGDYAVGLYNAAYNIVLGICSLISAFIVALYPFIAKTVQTSENYFNVVYKKSLKLILLIIFPLSMIIYLHAQSLLTILYGHAYDAALIIRILIFGESIAVIISLYGIILRSIDKQVKLLYILAVGALSNIILNALLIPTFSFIGASIATNISYIIVLILTFSYTTAMIKFNPINKDILAIICGGLCMFLIILIFKHANSYYLTFINIFVYILIITVSQSIDREELAPVLYVIKKYIY